MRSTVYFRLPPLLRLGAVSVLWATALFGQGPNTYQITPDTTTMLLGESRSLRMVDQNGRAQRKVTWTISEVDSMESIEGDELHLSPKHAGDFRLTARTDFATAEGTIKVIAASTLAPGTVKWSSGTRSGCKGTRIIPAVPSPNS